MLKGYLYQLNKSRCQSVEITEVEDYLTVYPQKKNPAVNS